MAIIWTTRHSAALGRTGLSLASLLALTFNPNAMEQSQLKFFRLVLALASYAESLSGDYYYNSDVPAFLLFVSIWTWLVYGGMLAIEHYAPQFYYRIGVLVGQLLSVILWISGWAWAASSADYILSFDNYGSHDSIRGAWKAFGQSIAACAGIGALVWVLCIITVVAFCSACRRSSVSVDVTTIELTNIPKSNAPDGQTASPSPRASNSKLTLNTREVS
ncbi:hypothetical protein O1611_g7828 [Lasiodiplodia mahajangana]|uniref:Uncharacterized protein n=1 Tax=Lasiodiplodia mahajangana TaxID=1108764 RepID=A0ACC2JEB3_9PEZI|nr:hypothetical protein O1611_g7828 [Lasiodiplodia mahajangana]